MAMTKIMIMKLQYVRTDLKKNKKIKKGLY